jgi:aminomethyltransferase
MTKKTPLYDMHQALGAHLTDFHDYLLPLEYTSITEEHLAVRNKAGIFDLSHMGEIEVVGRGALDFLQRLITNDAERLPDGQVLYTPLCNERGGILDDIILYRFNKERFLLIVNASNIQKIHRWLERHLISGANINNRSDEFGMIAVQGPSSGTIMEKALGKEEASLPHHQIMEKKMGDWELIISRTGYTGEDGFELYSPGPQCQGLWQRLMEVGTPLGLRPAGLAARDTLRLEAGLLLYGNDIDETTTPLEAGITWTVKFYKKDFLGKEALLAQKAVGVEKELIGLELQERGIPRKGYPILSDSNKIGEVTSGTYSPFTKKSIAMGYVKREFSGVGAPLCVEIRGRSIKAKVVELPFYRPKAREEG